MAVAPAGWENRFEVPVATGRMLKSKLPDSKRWRLLYPLDRFVQSIYPLIITKTDNWGLVPADGLRLKAAVGPFDSKTEAEFTTAVGHLHRVGLVEIFSADGDSWLFVVGHEREQKEGIRKRGGRAPDWMPAISKMEAAARERARLEWDRLKGQELPFREPSGNLPGTFREPSGDEGKGIEEKGSGMSRTEVFREPSGNLPGTVRPGGTTQPPADHLSTSSSAPIPPGKQPGTPESDAGAPALALIPPIAQNGCKSPTVPIRVWVQHIARTHAETFGRRFRGLPAGPLASRIAVAIGKFGMDRCLAACVGHREECRRNEKRGTSLRFAFPAGAENNAVNLDRIAEMADIGFEILDRERTNAKREAADSQKKTTKHKPVELDESNPIEKRGIEAMRRRKARVKK